MKIKNSVLEYTGGGAWCAYGELEDGTIFVGGGNESFEIYEHSVLDRIEELSKQWSDGLTILDVCGLEETADLVIRCTDDHSDETFNMWLQIYNAHECVDKDWLLDDLYEFNGKERPTEDSDKDDNPDHSMTYDEKVARVSEMTAEQLLDALDYYYTHWNPIDEGMGESRDIVKKEIIRRMEQ